MATKKPRDTAPAWALDALAVLHNVRHLIARQALGAKPHEQDQLDAARWLPEINRVLKQGPVPKARVATDADGPSPIERHFEE